MDDEGLILRHCSTLGRGFWRSCPRQDVYKVHPKLPGAARSAAALFSARHSAGCGCRGGEAGELLVRWMGNILHSIVCHITKDLVLLTYRITQDVVKKTCCAASMVFHSVSAVQSFVL